MLGGNVPYDKRPAVCVRGVYPRDLARRGDIAAAALTPGYPVELRTYECGLAALIGRGIVALVGRGLIQPTRPEAGASAHPHSVLVVEDNDDMREALVLLAQSVGLDAVPATNGRDALDQLRAGLRPCLILLDLRMPEMDGYGFRRAQLADPDIAAIPVGVVSVTQALPSDDAQALRLTNILGKPPDTAEVLRLLDHHCTLH